MMKSIKKFLIAASAILISFICAAESHATRPSFDIEKDLLLFHYDFKTDVDDVHTVAAVDLILRAEQYQNLNYHAVTGTYGVQAGAYVPANDLMAMVFGQNWSDAHMQRAASIVQVAHKMVKTAANGGRIWIAEAGQSDFTQEVMAYLVKAGKPLTKQQIILVQHSEWNENETSQAALAYVKENTLYFKIPDGNAVGNGSAGYNASAYSAKQLENKQLKTAKVWAKANEISIKYNGVNGRYDNKAISSGGVDFSDLSETVWILDIQNVDDPTQYFQQFNTFVGTWQQVDATENYAARHEAGFVEFEGKGYLIGGRGIKPVDEFDPTTLKWVELNESPIELHHFQPVVWQDKIVVAGALTGGYPAETPVPYIYYYYPKLNKWQQGPAIPKHRLRGSASAVVINDSLYLLGGITNGHLDGNVVWVDRFDFTTNTWTELPDAPHARDHAQAVYLDGNIYVVGGRRTQVKHNHVFDLVEAKVDVFDIKQNSWQVLEKPLPTPRAGIATYATNNAFIVVGGESADPNKAHEEVELFDIGSQTWHSKTPLTLGRHGTGVIQLNHYLWTASGSGMQGGLPELHSVERIKLDKIFNH